MGQDREEIGSLWANPESVKYCKDGLDYYINEYGLSSVLVALSIIALKLSQKSLYSMPHICDRLLKAIKYIDNPTKYQIIEVYPDDANN